MALKTIKSMQLLGNTTVRVVIYNEDAVDSNQVFTGKVKDMPKDVARLKPAFITTSLQQDYAECSAKAIIMIFVSNEDETAKRFLAARKTEAANMQRGLADASNHD